MEVCTTYDNKCESIITLTKYNKTLGYSIYVYVGCSYTNGRISNIMRFKYFNFAPSLLGGPTYPVLKFTQIIELELGLCESEEALLSYLNGWNNCFVLETKRRKNCTEIAQDELKYGHLFISLNIWDEDAHLIFSIYTLLKTLFPSIYRLWNLTRYFPLCLQVLIYCWRLSFSVVNIWLQNVFAVMNQTKEEDNFLTKKGMKVEVARIFIIVYNIALKLSVYYSIYCYFYWLKFTNDEDNQQAVHFCHFVPILLIVILYITLTVFLIISFINLYYTQIFNLIFLYWETFYKKLDQNVLLKVCFLNTW
uniref:Seipin n=1 Tax=Heterorhabditis bacteriophora TaxID=37862 RepID=A0A1I7WQT7_HETBA